MNRNCLIANLAAVTALVATGIMIKTDPAMAQQTNREADEVVVVEAPIKRQTVGRSAATGAKTEIIELSRQVNFSDLDLSKHADVIELEKRIEATAKEACMKLDEMFPLAASDPGDRWRCTRQAVASAEEQFQGAIEDAASR